MKILNPNFRGLFSQGFFQGSLSDARSQKEQLEKRISLNYSHDSSSGYLVKYLSSEGASSFATCIQNVFRTPGLYVYAENVDEDTADIVAILTTAQGEQRSFQLKVYSDGTAAIDKTTTIPSSGGRRSFHISRVNSAKNLHTQIDLYSNNESIDSKAIAIPPLYAVNSAEQKELVTSTPSRADCGLYRDSNAYPGTTVKIVPTDPAATFVLSTLTPSMTMLQGKNGHVPGAGSKMEITSQTPTIITAHALCVPGSSTDDPYHVEGTISAYASKWIVTKKEPDDSKIRPIFKLIVD